MRLEDRGVQLLPWQEDRLNSFINHTAISLETANASSSRRCGKTYLSYVINMVEAFKHREYIANPRYDPDITTLDKLHYWHSGLVLFVTQHFPEYTAVYSRPKGVVTISRKNKLKLLLDAFQKGEL